MYLSKEGQKSLTLAPSLLQFTSTLPHFLAPLLQIIPHHIVTTNTSTETSVTHFLGQQPTANIMVSSVNKPLEIQLPDNAYLYQNKHKFPVS